MSGDLGLNPLVLYNWNPATQLMNYLTAEAAVMAGEPGAAAKIVTLGDSTTAGVGDSPTNIDYRNGPSYPNDLAKDIAAAGVPAQSDNFLGGIVGEDGRVNLLGDANWSDVSVPGGRAIGIQSAGSGFRFMLTSPGDYDTLKLNYVDVGTGVMTVSVDGAPITTVKLGNTQQISTQTIALSPGLHSELTVLSATGAPVYVAGAAFENAAVPAVEVYNAGSPGTESYVVGQGATIGDVQYAGIGQLQGIIALSPSLVLIDYGVNDINNGTATPAQTAANIAHAVTDLRRNGTDAIIIIPEPFFSPYYAAELPVLRADLQGVSDLLNVPIIDLSATFGDSFPALFAAGLMSDGLHPNAALYADIASDYSRLLTAGAMRNETLSAVDSTLAVPSGARLLLTGAGNTVTAGYGALVDVVGDGNRVAASAGDTVNVAGNDTVVTSAGGISVNLEGDGSSVTTGPSYIGLQHGTGVAINMSNGVIGLQDGVGMLLTGSGNTVTAGRDTLVGVVGDGNRVTASAGDTVNVAGNDAVVTSMERIGVNLEGNDASVTAGPSYVSLHHGTGAAINVSDSIVLLQGGTGARLTGAGNTVTVGYGALVDVVGDGNQVAASAGDTVNIAGNDAVVISADGISVNLEGNGSSVTAGPSYVGLQHGTGVAINVSGGVIVLQDGTGAVISGSGNTVSLGLDVNAVISGYGNKIHGAMQATGDAAINSISVGGDANMVFLSGAAKVFDTSSSLSLVLSGSQPLPANIVDDVMGFGAARGGVIDLSNAAGGYANASAALQSLKTDGQGGSLLPFGAGSAVDFVDLTPAAFSLANFRIDVPPR